MGKERDAKRTRMLGVSNVSCATCSNWSPLAVSGHRSFKTGATRDLGGIGAWRRFCAEHDIIYQGFSLLTANVEVLRHPLIAQLARGLRQVPRRSSLVFARAVAILPLTGTSNLEHMKQDLAALDLSLTPTEVSSIEQMAG